MGRNRRGQERLERKRRRPGMLGRNRRGQEGLLGNRRGQEGLVRKRRHVREEQEWTGRVVRGQGGVVGT